jgi:hypothetical protein
MLLWVPLQNLHPCIILQACFAISFLLFSSLSSGLSFCVAVFVPLGGLLGVHTMHHFSPYVLQ